MNCTQLHRIGVVTLGLAYQPDLSSNRGQSLCGRTVRLSLYSQRAAFSQTDRIYFVSINSRQGTTANAGCHRVFLDFIGGIPRFTIPCGPLMWSGCPAHQVQVSAMTSQLQRSLHPTEQNCSAWWKLSFTEGSMLVLPLLPFPSVGLFGV